MCCFFYDTATTDGYTYLHTHALHDALPILVNRVGDFGFARGIVALFAAVGSVNFDTVFHAAPGLAGKTFHFLWKDWDILNVATFLQIGRASCRERVCQYV